MRPEDWVQGPVLQVIDGDSFVMQVEIVGEANDYPYNPTERIRLDTSAPALGTEAGEEAKKKLEAQIAGKNVRCYVKSRDEQGDLLCDVTVVD